MTLRKLLQCNLLAVGIVTLVYSLAFPYGVAVESYQFSSLSYYGPGQLSFEDYYAEAWQQGFWWLTVIGVVMVLLAVLLLVIFRKSDSHPETMPAVMVSGGVMLETVAFLQAWSVAMGQAYDVGQFDAFLNSGSGDTLTRLPDGAMILEIATDTAVHSPWEYLSSGYEDQLWLVGLGAVLIVIGIVAAFRRKPEQEIPAEETEEAEAPEEIPEKIIIPREEAVIRLYCTVMDIRGDYALVKYDDTGIESEVAIALLPLGIDVGDKLKYENYEFDRV